MEGLTGSSEADCLGEHSLIAPLRGSNWRRGGKRPAGQMLRDVRRRSVREGYGLGLLRCANYCTVCCVVSIYLLRIINVLMCKAQSAMALSRIYPGLPPQMLAEGISAPEALP